MKRLYAEDRPMFYIYLIVQIIAVLLLFYSLFLYATDTSLPFAGEEWFLVVNAAQLLLFPYFPILFEKVFNARVPRILFFLNILFIVCTAGIGELAGVYAQNQWWDKVMHIFSGAILTIIGFSLIDLMNPSETARKLNPIFATLFAFSFAMMVGVIWEVFEYWMDSMLGTNMQRHINSLTGIPFIGNRALWDTMWDFITNIIGAVIVSIYGYLALVNPKDKKFNKLIIRLNEERKEK
jgi:uncharacterized membrane protein YjdF